MNKEGDLILDYIKEKEWELNADYFPNHKHWEIVIHTNPNGMYSQEITGAYGETLNEALRKAFDKIATR